MARLPRLTVTDYPHHVILRGNNRQDIFAGDADMRRMLKLLEEHSVVQGVDVHAYVLMSNHLHLLLTPRRERALPLMMQSVGRSYVRAFNLAQGRTGTLWEGRYRSALIQTERYLLTCMAYIDLNPVRAGMVNTPEDYPWSSHAHYIGREQQSLITPHALYWEMGNTPFAREAAYTRGNFWPTATRSHRCHAEWVGPGRRGVSGRAGGANPQAGPARQGRKAGS